MIVFVAIGTAPAHIAEAIAQARRADKDATIALLADRLSRDVRTAARAHQVECVDIDPLRQDDRVKAFYGRDDNRRRFRQGFWQHTTGRFFVLRAFMEREGVDEATHLEHDVLLYAPERHVRPHGDVAAGAMATVFENRTRAIPGVLRIGARRTLDTFLDVILAEPRFTAGLSTDMERIADFRGEHPDLVVDLPTCPPANGQEATRSLFDDRSLPLAAHGPAWLFDGARFGQYLGGIDPRNERRRLDRWLRRQHGTLECPNGFVNESCIDDPSQYRYVVAVPMGLPSPAVRVGARTYPLATLHVHSKKLYRFTSPALQPLVGRDA